MGKIAEFEDAAVTQSETTEIVIGMLIAMRDGQPVVDFTGNPNSRPIQAIATCHIDPTHVGRQVALLFAERDMARPIVIGVVRGHLTPQHPSVAVPQYASNPMVWGANNNNLVIKGTGQMVFQCGQASLSLTEQGRIIMRGTHIASYSDGVNRIRGAMVEVN
jgi:hypothetical protein